MARGVHRSNTYGGAFTYSKFHARRRGERLWSRFEGPIRVAVDAEGAASDLFGAMSRRDRNLIIRQSLVAAGNFWIRVFLPKRFTEYARRLGYRPSNDWSEAKRKLYGHNIPLVMTGEMRAAAINGAKASATSTAKKTQIRITMPLGHPVQKNTARFVHRVPPWELERIAQETAKAMRGILSGTFAWTDQGVSASAPVPITQRPAAFNHARPSPRTVRRSA